MQESASCVYFRCEKKIPPIGPLDKSCDNETGISFSMRAAKALALLYSAIMTMTMTMTMDLFQSRAHEGQKS